MVKTILFSFCVIALSAVISAPAVAQDDDIIRNPDGKTGSASLDVHSGWTRNTAFWRQDGQFGPGIGPGRDDNGLAWRTSAAWPLSSKTSLLLDINGARRLGAADNSWLAGIRYFTSPIGSGVAMNPDGALGSVVLEGKAGYHRLSGFHGARVDAGLTVPLKPLLSWNMSVSWNLTDWGESGIDKLNDITLRSGINIYSHILTFDDENANPDGPLGSANVSLHGGFRRRGDDNGGLWGVELNMPMHTWLTPYIAFEMQNIDDVITLGPGLVNPDNPRNGLQPHELNSLINTIVIGLRIY